MVTACTKYITDFKSSSMEPGKSPLALLAKTCETIGLPETPSKKSPSDLSNKNTDKKVDVKPKTSPRSTPASKEPTMTFPGLPKPPFPMGMPPMPFPFFNPMMPYPMAFPGAFPGFMGRMPCPFAMMRQPCMTPGCTQCIPTSSSAGPTPEMMAQFATHPLFSAYAGMMPTVSGSSGMPSYQSLLAAAAGATPATPKQSPAQPSESTPSTQKHQCLWAQPNGTCGKTFESQEALNEHVKSVHTPSPPSSASSAPKSESPKITKTPTSRPSSSASQVRFNPYAKPTMPTMNPMSMPMLPFPLQAMYTQRLMSSMPHP
ncbi:unnamed protein product [Caenorhabditis bovis]|uniref:C2H2-type domain-containing protein n=1 Tax=Caenorhabditis bovis TaxID=2654633 RepID=A0A8S1F2R2_9PELO|nr:unnamed protein product [Caenorhabditis bovis]